MDQLTVYTIYESACDEKLNEYRDTWSSYFRNYKLQQPVDLEGLLSYISYLENKIQEYENLQIPGCNFNVRNDIVKVIHEKEVAIKKEKEEIENKYSRKKSELEKAHAQEVENAGVAAKESVSDLRSMKEELVTYKSKLSDLFDRYNILPCDIVFADDLSREEIQSLLEDSIKTCSSYFSYTVNSKLYAVKKVLCVSDSPVISILKIIGFILSLTLFSPILLFYCFFRMYKVTNNMYSNLEKLRVANALMYYDDFDKYINQDDYKVDDINMSSLEEEKEIELSTVEDVSGIYDIVDRVIAENANELSKKQVARNDSIKSLRNDTVCMLKGVLKDMKDTLAKETQSNKKIGTAISNHLYMTHKFITNEITEVSYDTLDMSAENIVFSDNDPISMINYMKLLYCNMLLDVKEKHLYTYVCDDLHLGTYFSEFYDPETKDYITAITDQMDKVVESIKKEVEDRIRILHDTCVDVHNKKCEEIGKIAMDYKLYIFVGDTERLMKMDIFRSLLQYTAKYGIHMWVLGKANTGIEHCMYFSEPFYTNVGKPIPYTKELGEEVFKLYKEVYSNSKDTGLDYMSKYSEKYIPRDKWWTFDTKSGIELRFGLVDGDPEKPYGIKLGDAPVHGLVVGDTGAGKSAMINQMLASLVTMYSPDELQLVMIDFKNIEFSFYADPETHTFSRLPHASVLSGTKDGEYAVSIFDYLYKEMTRRTAIFQEANVKKLEDYRKKYPDKVMPRILFLVDEFQVMFQEVPQKILNVIMDKITALAKLARFCGCHMLFCSQSMSGTMPADILNQYNLRVALRCGSDLAVNFFGCEKPSQIKSKFGYLYTNENKGSTRDSDKLWRVPFIPEKDLDNIISEINKMYNKKITTEFYDEARPCYEADLQNWYKNYNDSFKDGHILILGERTSFSVNKVPPYIQTTKEDGDNILIFANRRLDSMNIVKTLIENIENSENAEFLIHTADRDVFDILDIKSLVGEDIAKYCNADTKIESLLDIWESVVETREEMNKDELTPLYILTLNYEKCAGIGKNSNYKVSERFENLLKSGPAVDVHFISLFRDKGELQNSFFKLYDHKLVAKIDSTLAFSLVDTDSPTKYPDNDNDGLFCLYKHGTAETKFKIYRHEFAAPLTAKEIFIA